MKKKASDIARTIVFSLLVWASFSVNAQTIPSTSPKKCGKPTIKKTTKKKVKKPTIVIPKDYQPPVAARQVYTFRETHANRKRLKKLKRQRKKAKGCLATNF